jgi:hypothetical protein
MKHDFMCKHHVGEVGFWLDYSMGTFLKNDSYTHSRIFLFGARAPPPPVGQGLLIHEVYRPQRPTTVGRTPLDE